MHVPFPPCLISYAIPCISCSTPLHFMYNAVNLLFCLPLFCVQCCTFPIRHAFKLNAVLYISYSASSHFICNTVHYLLCDSSFLMLYCIGSEPEPRSGTFISAPDQIIEYKACTLKQLTLTLSSESNYFLLLFPLFETYVLFR